MRAETRKKIFYLLAGAFVLIVPAIIAYSLGYTLNLSTGALEQGGGIFIKSKTPRLSISLDGEFQKETSLISGGALLTDLAPGEHLLRLEKEGHQPWFKNVAVEAARVDEFRNVMLIPLRPEASTSSAAEIAEARAADTATSTRKLGLDKKNNLTETATINGRASSTVLTANVYSFAEFGGIIYFINESGFAARLDGTGELATLGRPGFYIEKGKPAKFFLSPLGELFILDAAGGLFILESEAEELKHLADSIQNIAFDTEGEKVLLNTSRGIEMFWRTDNEYQPFQKKGDRESILNLSSPELEAEWFLEDDAHIVIRNNSGIFLTEIDGRGGRNTAELFSEKTDELLTSPAYPEVIYFRQGKTWHRFEL